MQTETLIKKFSLQGRTALITGAGRGIGRAVATAMARAGADIVVMDVVATNVRETVRFLETETGAKIYPAVFDLSLTNQIPDRVREVLAACGKVDILVNNAGIQVRKPALEFTTDEWNAVLNIHLTASFAMAHALVPGMIARGGGTIINIASINSMMAVPNIIAYTTAKSGVAGLTRSMAVEWSASGIRTNAIGPGWCRTELTAKLFRDPEKEKWVMGRIPMKRVADPENDLGYVAVFLASDAAAYMTGQVIYVDGGWLAS